jgi:molybdopterin synthase catalytic subunit
MIRLQSEPIEIAELISSVADDSDGAISLFLGRVRDSSRGRDVLYLEYQAYDEMAQREIARIAQEAAARFALSAVAIIHRTGKVEIGEISVGVAAASVHRAEAMEGCRFIIDNLKKSVPIWKKEFYEGGSFWVGSGG